MVCFFLLVAMIFTLEKGILIIVSRSNGLMMYENYRVCLERRKLVYGNQARPDVSAPAANLTM